MQSYLRQTDTLLQERDRVLALLTLSPSCSIVRNTLYGCKLNQDGEAILTVPGERGSILIYRLTITLDSLATLEKKESGITGMAKTGGKDEH